MVMLDGRTMRRPSIEFVNIEFINIDFITNYCWIRCSLQGSPQVQS